MDDLNEEYYDSPELCSYELSDFKGKKMGRSREDDVYVKAKVGTRDTMLSSTEVCRVTGKVNGSRLIEDKIERLSEDEILDRMPHKAVSHMSVPSIRGEYLKVIECRGVTQDDDGNYELISGNHYIIPVEYVIDILDYNSAILELDN